MFNLPMKSLKGYFLVAAPNLTDSNFSQAVVLMLQHDQNGALGVVINRTLEVTVKQACEQVLETRCDIEANLHQGGPCEALLMVLHGQGEIDADGDDADDAVLPGLYFSTDKDTIEQLVRSPTGSLKFVVGYSGWGAGQLEEELKTGSWLITPATFDRVFGPYESLWNRLVSEANLSQWIDPRLIPDDPSMN
jgi:putative transcriptional regulator